SMTACGGNLIDGEISRNEQCPHEADLRLLRLRNWGNRSLGIKERFPQEYLNRNFFHAEAAVFSMVLLKALNVML
ncbi:MAG: hypothetical protein IK099_15910, partial [Clostridia bacterium]|nr:hypothetical protein [Clostridia bacterium]